MKTDYKLGQEFIPTRLQMWVNKNHTEYLIIDNENETIYKGTPQEMEQLWKDLKEKSGY